MGEIVVGVPHRHSSFEVSVVLIYRGVTRTKRMCNSLHGGWENMSRNHGSRAMAERDVEDYEPGVLRVFQAKSETRAFYDKIAHVYDLLAEKSEQPMREAGLQVLAAQPGEKVLEIGFGTGHCLVELAEAVGATGRVFGIDISEKMRDIAGELAAKQGVADRIELVCGDAEQLPYDADSLDGVFMSFTLELFDTPEIPLVLGECLRVLKPGGRLSVVAVSKEGRPGLVLKAFEWTHRHFPNLMDCRPIYVQAAVEASGFSIRHAETRSMWVPVEIILGVKEA